MKITVYHPDKKKTGLILSPLFTNSKPFERILEELSEYRLLIPVLDGMTKDTVFRSIEREGDLLYQYVRDHNITNLDFILGFSIGANIALELYSRGHLTVRKIILDGALYQNRNKVIQKIASLKFKNYRKNFLKGNIRRENIEKKYPGLYEDFKDLLPVLDDESIKNGIRSVCSFSFPKLKYSLGQILFIYGQYDPNIEYGDKLRRKYDKADFLRVENMYHCSYIIQDPKDFLSFL